MKKCKNCQSVFFTLPEKTDLEHPLNSMKTSAMDYFERGFMQATNVIMRKLPLMCFRRNVRETLVQFVKRRIDFEWMTCTEHRRILSEKFLQSIVVFTINQWCSHLNKILSGSIMLHGGSIVEQNARQVYLKIRKQNQGVDKQ